MRKILITFFIYFIFFWTSFAIDDIKIISRSERWADENYRYLDSPEWQQILATREKASQNWLEKVKNMTEEEKAKSDEQAKRQKEILDSKNNYLSENYTKENTLVEVIKEQDWHKLAWPIQKTNYVEWIVIHHTEWKYESSLKWIQSIYKYHAINRWWWDIWYNFVIWYDWEIFEWRAWWDYVVWAHAMWNNRSTVWISVMWNYDEDELSQKQKDSLDKLIKYLLKKYWINTNWVFYYHKECISWNCLTPLETETKSPIVWHKDAGHTSCPWENIYKLLDSFNEENKEYSKNFSFVPYKNNQTKKSTNLDFSTLDYDKLLDVLVNIEQRLDKEKKSNLLMLKEDIIKELNIRNISLDSKKENKKTIDETEKIKVKLSYPDNDYIEIKSWDEKYEIKREWNYLLVNWEKQKAYVVKSNLSWFVEISSWDRIPSWDSTKNYNDNKFKWDIYVYVKNNKLYVVNNVLLLDYLKWLWEVSNSENTEKIKTIIISARTYAYWYMKKDRKFDWEFYDASDDPDVFQKYLWYWLEQRSPNINKIVENTKWEFITYDWEIIKPWYFSSSEWKTLSFNDYCLAKYDNSDCKEYLWKYPFLSSVKDPGWIWKNKAWHWVWISWVWTSYFSSRWWSHQIIISYFLRGVKVERL